MIRVSAVSSTAAALLAMLMLAATGCAAWPRLYAPLPALPPAAANADTVFVMADGARLPVRVWRPPGPPRGVVLALHGMNDSRDAWEYPGPAFAAAGLLLFAPDQRGFGAAPGRGLFAGGDRLVADAAEMLRQLAARYPGLPLYAMGESMGAAVLMLLAASPDPPPVRGWILSAPAVWGRAQMGVMLSSGLWLVSTLAPGLSFTGAEVPVRILASDNREALVRLARDPLTIRRTRADALRGLTDLMDRAQAAAARLPPTTLVLYGGHDMLVPTPSMARAWAAMPPGVRRAFYPGGYHLLLRDKGRAAPIGDILAWIDDPGGWLPSGADLAAAAWAATLPR